MITANFESFKFKTTVTRRTPAGCNTNNMEIVVSLTYLTNIKRIHEIAK